jgi:hypothetical protein
MSLPLPVPRNRSFSFKTGQHAGLIADKRSFRVNGIANPGDYSHWYRARAPLLHGVRVHRHCHKKSQTADTVQDSGGGTGGGYGGRSTAGSGSYPQNYYFTFDCAGEWKSYTDPVWENHHGSFTLTGNVPFPITYDFP